MFIEPNKIIFKQDHKGVYRNKDHNLCVIDNSTFENYSESTIISDAKTDETLFTGYYGEVIAELSQRLGVNWDDIYMLSYMAQKGRHNDMAIKIGTGHLTKGTRFHASDLPGKHPRTMVLTVKEIHPNGPGSMVVVCEEMERAPFGEDTPTNITFHIDFVSNILHRPVDHAPAWDVKGFDPRMDSADISVRFNDHVAPGKRFVDWSTFMYIVSHAERDNTLMYRREFDGDKLLKRLRSMGLVRVVHIRDLVIYNHREAVVSYHVDAKRALKFIRKNPHWAFETIKTSCAHDAEFWDSAMSELDDLDLTS